MNKRDRFVAQLRKEAGARGLEVRVETWCGWPREVRVGDRVTTLPARDIDPETARKIRKALGLDLGTAR